MLNKQYLCGKQKQYSETVKVVVIMACLNGMYEANKTLKGRKAKRSAPSSWRSANWTKKQKEGDGAWSLTVALTMSAGLELIFFTLQLQPASDKRCKLDNEHKYLI